MAIQPTLPRMLVGDAPAVAMSSLGQFRIPGGAAGGNAFDALYAQAVDTALRTTGIETFEALREAGSAKLAQLPPANGAEYGGAPIARRLQDVARLIRSGVGLQVAATDMGGWDT
ncbi:MAG TPA: transcriptional initiation protein Tat, partial [Myxococcaceae bacterium]|nr:transcriptional initiation protein Tat [Myxococcaceae bacterium]